MTSDDFIFRIDRSRSQFSRLELEGCLRKFAEATGSLSPAMRDFDKWPDRIATSDTYRRYYGSWGKALQAAGLRTIRGMKLDPKAMVEAFKACWKEYQSVPSQRQLAAYLERGKYPFRYKTYL